MSLKNYFHASSMPYFRLSAIKSQIRYPIDPTAIVELQLQILKMRTLQHNILGSLQNKN